MTILKSRLCVCVCVLFFVCTVCAYVQYATVRARIMRVVEEFQCASVRGARACVRACVCACVRVCVRVREYIRMFLLHYATALPYYTR